MLKWAVIPRLNSDYLENEGTHNSDGCEMLTLQAIIERDRLPCLIRLPNDDMNECIDNYCLLLCQTNDPYLLVSNETERFSIPLSFDGKLLRRIILIISFYFNFKKSFFTCVGFLCLTHVFFYMHSK